MNQFKQQNFYLLALILITSIALFLIIPKFLNEATQDYRLAKSTGLDAVQKPAYVLQLKRKLKCPDTRLRFEKLQYGEYWLLKNLIRGYVSKGVGCLDTITYTTNGDFTFLEFLPTIVERWRGPVSFALFAPGADLFDTMNGIQFVRNCLPESNLIRKHVSFHIFFPTTHMPSLVPMNETEALAWSYDCDAEPPYLNVDRETMYKTKANLTYPINVGRNIARKAVNTHFIFACDIELIPSRGLAQNFLQMVAQNESLLPTESNPRVFVLPVFELQSNATLPESKDELKTMLASKTAIPFHYYVCSNCHLVPDQKGWLNTSETGTFSITAVGKRHGKLKYWEPFYISDNSEPVFDERVTWEGQSNKRIQNFAMCLLDYDYYVLHPPFLVHTPGIKKFDKHSPRLKFVWAMNLVIKKVIEPEYRILYGVNKNCRT